MPASRIIRSVGPFPLVEAAMNMKQTTLRSNSLPSKLINQIARFNAKSSTKPTCTMATVSVTQRHAVETMEQAKTVNKLNVYSQTTVVYVHISCDMKQITS